MAKPAPILAAAAVLLAASLAPNAARADAVLRMVPQADLKIFDPVWTTASITLNHAYMVYDTLFSLDSKLVPKPVMVESHSVSADGLTYTFVLRSGLKFSDGSPVRAQDAVTSVRRWAARNAAGKVLMGLTAELKTVDERSFTLVLKKPYGGVLSALADQIGPFVMREEEAKTDPAEQVRKIIGSGPFLFAESEWVPGNKVVYRRNPTFSPRAEPPDGLAGNKVAKVERVEWIYIPDANTAANALLKGEVDMIDMPAGDILPLLERDKDIVVQKVHPVGGFGFFRPNGLHPPFNNIKARQALALIASQEDFLAAGFGDKKWWNTCFSYYVCKSAYGTEVGSEPFRKPDIARAKQLLAEAGYKGEKIHVIGTKEIAHIGAITEVLVDGLRKAGVNVELEMMDWGTMVTRFGSNKNVPGVQGGWHLWSASGSWSTWHNPLTNLGTNMSTDSSWAGWAADEEVEKLRNAFIAAGTKDERMAALDKLHKRLWEVVPYVMTGQYDQPYAWRKNVSGVLPTSKLVLFNIAKD